MFGGAFFLKNKRDMKKELDKVAKDIFERFSENNKVYVTADGQGFFKKAHAVNHSLINRTGEELKITAFEREVEEIEAIEEVKTAKELIEILKTATLEEVAGIAKAELALGDKARKSVALAAEKRATKLKEAE